MIIPASEDEPAVTFTRFARDWFCLLARGAFADAASRLDEPNSYGERWNAEQIQEALRNYAHTEAVQVSDPDTLAGDGRPSLVEFDDGRGYSFYHAVPLRGEWSDLTAQFEFLRRPQGYAVVLHDIHVL
jgi:hypothetical protein